MAGRTQRAIDSFLSETGLVADLMVLLQMSQADTLRLNTAILEFEPGTPIIQAEELQQFASQRGVPYDWADAWITVANLLSNVDLEPGTAEFRELVSKLADEIPTQDSIEVRATQLDRLLSALHPASAVLSRRMKLNRRLSRAMPTFVTCTVDCDLRLLRSKAGSSQYAPIAVVRIRLDEGDDLIFQGSTQGIRQLIAVLQKADENLAEALRHSLVLSQNKALGAAPSYDEREL